MTNLVRDIYDLCMLSKMKHDLSKSAKLLLQVFAIRYPSNRTLPGPSKLIHIIFGSMVT